MKRATVLLFFATASAAGPVNDGARPGAAYFVGRTGSSWSYETNDKAKSKARVTVDSVENWASHFHVDWGKRSTSGVWRARDGAWVEKLPGHEQESIVLPAQVVVGARWSGPSSIERGEKSPSKFEVISMDAQVELPNGGTRENCVAVLETSDSGGAPYTHFYAPNTGKVAVQVGDGWLLRLIEFRAGRGGGE